MPQGATGLHHVTAIASDPRRNLDFYAGVLGLRLVKRTVNFDDPGTYHLYYGDAAGQPGTILTFFPWQGIDRGRAGSGQAVEVAFAIPQASFGWWTTHLVHCGIPYEGPSDRFGERVLFLKDPDGMMIELVATPGHSRPDQEWEGATIPAEHRILRIHTVTLWLDGYEKSADLLTGKLGFHKVAEEGSRFRYAAGEGGPGAQVDLRCTPEFWTGRMGTGSVHHVAWRVPDDAAQTQLRTMLAGGGIDITPVLDRQYFRSVYFREPGGVLFEIATDPPGFAVDETFELLGTALKLPPWLEGQRAAIEQRLPPLHLPGVTTV